MGQNFSPSTLGRLSGAEKRLFGAPERCVAAMSNSRTSSQEDRVLRPFKGISEGDSAPREACPDLPLRRLPVIENHHGAKHSLKKLGDENLP